MQCVTTCATPLQNVVTHCICTTHRVYWLDPHQFFGQPTCLNLAVPRTPLQISSCYFLGNRNLAGSQSRLGASILACRTTRFVFPACSERPPSIRGRSCAFACFCAFVFTYNIAQIFSRKGFPVSGSVIHYNTQDYRKILVRLQKHE